MEPRESYMDSGWHIQSFGAGDKRCAGSNKSVGLKEEMTPAISVDQLFLVTKKCGGGSVEPGFFQNKNSFSAF